MTRILTILTLALSAMLSARAQQLTEVDLQPTTDIMKVSMQQQDLNGEVCAIVKVRIPAEGVKFDGDVLRAGGFPGWEYRGSEYWVWMLPGTKMFEIHVPGVAPYRVRTRDYGIPRLESKNIYILTATVPRTATANQPDSNKGYLVITPSPEQTDVTIDDKSYGQTPIVLNDLEPGRHTVSLSCNGYLPYTTIVNLRPGIPVALSPEMTVLNTEPIKVQEVKETNKKEKQIKERQNKETAKARKPKKEKAKGTINKGRLIANIAQSVLLFPIGLGSWLWNPVRG